MPRYLAKLELDQDYEADSEEEARRKFCQDYGLNFYSLAMEEYCEVERID
jgi:hypothetical protein